MASLSSFPRSAATVAVSVCMGAALLVANVHALPPGRSWAVVEGLSYPGVGFFAGIRLEVTDSGLPKLITAAYWDTSAIGRWCVFSWTDSTWGEVFFSNIVAENFPEPVLSLVDQEYLVWKYSDDLTGVHYMLISEMTESSIEPPDTAMVTVSGSSEYSAAVSSQRKWVARSEYRAGQWKIRVVYSDAPGTWLELPTVGVDEPMCAIAPLSDTAAIVAYANGVGLGWSRAEGDQWVEHGVLDSRIDLAFHPTFRKKPSGGWWLVWADLAHMHVASYVDGVWDYGDSLTCAHNPGETFWSAWSDASRDTAERPVLVWGDLGVGYTYRDVGCIAFPTASGWALGEEIPGCDGMFLTPYVTRDLNGDAWVAWSRSFPTFYTHTYVSATCSAPNIDASGPAPVVRWILSELAPETWWSVERAEGSGDFESLARVVASPALEVSWTDESAPPGTLRYRIRRESVDTRYQWVSAETVWSATGVPAPPPLAITLAAPRPNPMRESATIDFELSAETVVDLEIYDVTGHLVQRLAAHERLPAGRHTRGWSGQRAGGVDTASGLYFIRLQAGGHVRTTKLVMVQ